MSFSNMTMLEGIAYVAGFIDGEGCFMLKQNKRGFFQPLVTCCNTNKFVLERTQEFLLTTSCIAAKLYESSRDGNRKRLWRLDILDHTSIEKLCLLLRPYSVVKREQLDCLLRFFEIRRVEGRNGNFLLNDKLAIHASIKILNKRGN